MGSIVGAALVSHHPGLMQCEEFRVLMGAGQDSDLIPGYARVRERIEARIDEHRRALRWAIADIKGQRRTTVELI